MSQVAKANWAASVPWIGITGKPTAFGVNDIGQLGGNGFSVGQVPRWNGAIFLPYTVPSSSSPTPAPSPLPSQFTLTWDIPELLPLQTATEVFNVGGVFPGNPLALGWQFNPGFCWLWGLVTDIEVVTLYAKNMDSVPVTLGSGTWVVQRFN
jgi:hypothetical protein